MDPAGNKARCLLTVNHTTRSIHYHHHHYHNFSVDVQHVISLSCGKPPNESCFCGYVNGVTRGKTVPSMSVCKVSITAFCSEHCQ